LTGMSTQLPSPPNQPSCLTKTLRMYETCIILPSIVHGTFFTKNNSYVETICGTKSTSLCAVIGSSKYLSTFSCALHPSNLCYAT